MKEFIKALVSKNKSNIVPAEHNLFGHFVGEWDFEWIECSRFDGSRSSE